MQRVDTLTCVDDLAPRTGGEEQARAPGDTGRARDVSAARLEAIEHCYWVAFSFNIGMAVIKVAIALLGYNSLFVLDALVSAAIATQIAAVLIGLDMGLVDSPRYSYGKGKIQFLLALLLGGALVVAASYALGVTIKRFGWPVRGDSSSIAIGLALASTAANVMLTLFIRRSATSTFDVGVRKTATLQALGIFSALSVLQGAVLIGYRWLDAERIGRISISVIMVYLSVVIIRNALEGVMDQSTGEEPEKVIADLVAAVQGVERVGTVRTRRLGELILVDLEVAFDPNCTIAESDRLTAKIRQLLSRKMEQPEHAISISYCRV
jgi:cation diffusion facilitator family transporter